MNRRNFVSSLLALPVLNLFRPEPSYFYDWSEKVHKEYGSWTNDPYLAHLEYAPYGLSDVQGVFLNGREITHEDLGWSATRIVSGKNGSIVYVKQHPDTGLSYTEIVDKWTGKVYNSYDPDCPKWQCKYHTSWLESPDKGPEMTEELRKEFEEHISGLKRYMMLDGVTVVDRYEERMAKGVVHGHVRYEYRGKGV